MTDCGGRILLPNVVLSRVHTAAFPSDFLPEIFPSCESSFRHLYGHFSSRLADFPTGSTCRTCQHSVCRKLVVLPYTNFMSHGVQPITGGLAMNARRATRHVVFFPTPWLQHVEKRATNTMSCGLLLAV